VAIANALQLEAARATPALSHFNAKNAIGLYDTAMDKKPFKNLKFGLLRFLKSFLF